MTDYEALTTTQYEIHVNGNAMERQEVVEVQPADEVFVEVPSSFSVNLFVGASNRMLSVYAPDAVDYSTNTYTLPVHKLHEDLETFQDLIEDWLYSLDIAANASELIAAYVVSFVLQYFRQENTDLDFDAVLSVNSNLETILPQLRMDKLEKNEEEVADLGDCTICLDQIFDCQNTEAVKIPCGHVYHKPCILTWLHNSNSCPLCRTPLPLEESASN